VQHSTCHVATSHALAIEEYKLLNSCSCKVALIGGYAVMKYGEPRYTKHLDVWVNNSPQNSVRLIEALKRFGAPLRYDEITGVEFPHAWNNRVASTFHEMLFVVLNYNLTISEQLWPFA